MGRPDHALVQEWKVLHSIRSNIASQSYSIKSVVMLHSNQAFSVVPCTKGADTTLHTSTRHCCHVCISYWNQLLIWAAGKVYKILLRGSWRRRQIFQHAAYFSSSYRQRFYWQTAAHLPSEFYQWWRNWASLDLSVVNTSIWWGKHSK